MVTRSALPFVVALLLTASCGGDEGEEKDKQGDSKAPPTGWAAAVGDRGTLVQTFDDVNWEARTLTQTDLLAVACVGNLRGWAAGANGSVLATDDAGETWAPQDSRTNRTLRAIRLSHGSDRGLLGVIAGDDGTLRTTWDSGATWTEAASGTMAHLSGIAISHGRSIVVVVGDRGTVVQSNDEARSFSAHTIEGAGNLTGVGMDSSARVIAASDDRGAIWASFDQGGTFVLEHRGETPLSSIAIAEDAAWGVAVGHGGALFERDLGGRWTKAHAPVSVDLLAVIVSHDRDRGYAAGEDGAVLVKPAPSAGWIRADVPTRVTLRALEDLAPE